MSPDFPHPEDCNEVVFKGKFNSRPLTELITSWC